MVIYLYSDNWIFGQIGGIFVDRDDNVWITQRPRTVNKRDRRAQDGDKSICCFTAPSPPAVTGSRHLSFIFFPFYYTNKE